MEALPPDDALYTRVLRYALWLLGRRAYTERGIEEKLIKKAVLWAPKADSGEAEEPSPTSDARLTGEGAEEDVNPAEAVARVLNRLKELRFIDDVSFCERWVEERTRLRPRGQRALDQELAKKGIPRDTRAAFWAGSAGTAFDERDAARRVLEKHLPRLERKASGRELHQKCFATLARQGFSLEVVKATVEERLRGLPREHPAQAVQRD